MTYAERFTHEGGGIVAHVRSENAIKGVEKIARRSTVEYFFHFADKSRARVRPARLQEIRISLNRLGNEVA